MFLMVLNSCSNQERKDSVIVEEQSEVEGQNHIYMNAVELSWEEKLPVSIEVGEYTFSGAAKFRGGSSSKYHKHSFSLKLDSSSVLLGLPKRKKYVLNAAYIDKTLVRHKLAYDLFRSMSSRNKAPKSVFAHLNLNGSYEGAYLVMEKVDAEMVGIEGGDGGVLLKDGGIFRKGTEFIPQDSSNYFHQKFPKIDSLDFSEDIRKFQNWIYDSDDKEFLERVDEFIDLGNVIDWHLLLLLTNNEDGVLKNFYWFRASSNQPWRVVPWDYDHSLGRDGDGELNELQRRVDPLRNKLLKRLYLHDSLNYPEHLARRFHSLADGAFHVDSLSDRVRQLEKQVEPYMMENIKRWPHSDTTFYFDQNEFDEELQIIYNFIPIRIDQLKQQFSQWETL